MPPRFAYWTILIDDKPTAFRAQKQEELLPTFKQLSRTNPNIVMRWFARGRLWDNPEQAQWALTNAPKKRERRGPDWRPGGQNKDPRARFSKPGRPSGKAPGPRVKEGEGRTEFSAGGRHRPKGPRTGHERPGAARDKRPWTTRDRPPGTTRDRGPKAWGQGSRAPKNHGPRPPKDREPETTRDRRRGPTRGKGPAKDKGPGTKD